MMRISSKAIVITVLLMMLCAATSFVQAQDAVNYYYEEGAWLDIADNIGDDKGPGYYQYPLDKRLRRGTFDLKRFRVYEEGSVVVFEIQMRNYIMREWPDTRKSEDQGFVANMWDIYIDIDGRENSGYQMALPGRDLMFSGNLGWEKVVIITPLSEFEVFDILRNKTDELDFQNRVDDVVYPDYVRVERDKMIVKIAKSKLPGISERSGYQCLAMGYSRIVSPNRLLNRDVRGFPTFDDFGGGHDSYGDPPVMDIIVPEGDDQYKILRDFRSEPYRENIRYASVPFVFAGGKKHAPGMKPVVKEPAATLGINIPPPAIIPPPTAPTAQPKPISTPRPTAPAKPAPIATQNSSGFVPLKPVASSKPKEGFKPIPKAPDGFIPVKKKD
ncbi:MAG TPA: hypothetical protein DCG57_17275 [Candidatus Riflebacteria bacterium]|jgi:hypothetical protein|nr:hypothetical protein [Candidatus Riflebacteria bacterium]